MVCNISKNQHRKFNIELNYSTLFVYNSIDKYRACDRKRRSHHPTNRKLINKNGPYRAILRSV